MSHAIEAYIVLNFIVIRCTFWCVH